MGLSFTQVLALIALPFIAQILTAAESPPAGSANTQPTFDATLLKEGRYTYRMTMQGKSLGDSVIEIRHGGSTYRLTMDAIEIGQSWQASVDTSFAPLAAHLVMESRDVPYEMTLSYDGRKVSGEERSNGVATPISATSKGVVIDQRVDWASMMAVQATAGNSVTMNVFDPATGFSPLVGRVQATPAMSGVWGTTDAMRLDYSICKLDRVEHYTVFATTSTPRYMLRGHAERTGDRAHPYRAVVFDRLAFGELLAVVFNRTAARTPGAPLTIVHRAGAKARLIHTAGVRPSVTSSSTVLCMPSP